jgi:signal transduction histidine kinase
VYLDLLGDAAKGIARPPNPEAAEGWQATALDQVSRLDRLVDSILASVRGEGLTGLSRAPFDAVEAVGETVETLRLLLRPHPIRWERPAEHLIAIGDEARFRQVLEQLLENESKYAPLEKGVSIGIWRLGDEIQAYVTDDGPGVPIEDWESVFEPFVRIEGRGRSRGSGIGLFAARRLMDAMGGRIYLEPNGFGGSRFVVALPVGGR